MVRGRPERCRTGRILLFRRRLLDFESSIVLRTLMDETWGYCAGGRWRGLFQERLMSAALKQMTSERVFLGWAEGGGDGRVGIA